MKNNIRARRTRHAAALENLSVAPSSVATPSTASRARQTRRSMLTPPPSVAPSELTARMGSFAMASPVATRSAKNAATMPSPPLQEHSFFAQNRAILLAGLPPSPETSPPLPVDDKEASPETDPETASRPIPIPDSSSGSRISRRPLHRRLTPLVTRNSRQLLAADSPGPMASPRVLSPCVYVRATSLKHQNAAEPRSMSEPGDADTASAAEPPPLKEGQLSICAFVRPSAADETPYVLRRTVDRETLARAVPQPEGRSAASVNILPSPVSRSPLSTLPSLNASMLSPVAGIKRRASPSPLSTPSPPPSTRHRRQSSQPDVLSPAQFPTSGGIPIPMRPHPALGVLPGLAAVILSGHVYPGDVIEQPLPHPEAWPETVNFAYRTSGEITDAIRQNIEHLGGRAV